MRPGIQNGGMMVHHESDRSDRSGAGGQQSDASPVSNADWPGSARSASAYAELALCSLMRLEYARKKNSAKSLDHTRLVLVSLSAPDKEVLRRRLRILHMEFDAETASYDVLCAILAAAKCKAQDVLGDAWTGTFESIALCCGPQGSKSWKISDGVILDDISKLHSPNDTARLVLKALGEYVLKQPLAPRVHFDCRVDVFGFPWKIDEELTNICRGLFHSQVEFNLTDDTLSHACKDSSLDAHFMYFIDEDTGDDDAAQLSRRTVGTVAPIPELKVKDDVDHEGNAEPDSRLGDRVDDRNNSTPMRQTSRERALIFPSSPSSAEPLMVSFRVDGIDGECFRNAQNWILHARIKMEMKKCIAELAGLEPSDVELSLGPQVPPVYAIPAASSTLWPSESMYKEMEDALSRICHVHCNTANDNYGKGCHGTFNPDGAVWVHVRRTAPCPG